MLREAFGISIEGLRSPGSGSIHDRDRRERQEDRSSGAGPIPLATGEEPLDGEPARRTWTRSRGSSSRSGLISGCLTSWTDSGHPSMTTASSASTHGHARRFQKVTAQPARRANTCVMPIFCRRIPGVILPHWNRDWPSRSRRPAEPPNRPAHRRAGETANRQFMFPVSDALILTYAPARSADRRASTVS